jgi:hypothetical protein
MRKSGCLVTAVALVLAAAGAARADDKADMRAVIDKAIQAVGGADKQAAGKAVTFKLKGKSYVTGAATDYTGDWAVQPPDKLRFQLDLDINGMKITILQVFNGREGWTKFNNQTREMDKDAVAEFKEEMYAGGVIALLPLVKDKGYELSPVGEVMVGDQPAVGIRVSHEGHRDVNLFFDKKTGLLVKSERRIKDQMAGGQEVTQETLYSDYGDFNGTKHAKKVVIKRDGKDYADGEVTEFEVKDKLDDSVFAKP